MNQKKWELVKACFSEAIEVESADRDDFLRSIEDEVVRSEVAALVSAHVNSEDFISQPVAIEIGFLESEDDRSIGTSIDGYRIVRKVGSGGMGSVYLAEHTGEEFTQIVALKVIRRGMGTDSVLKRFLRERQILARLAHPYIARMLDGGSTKDGLPYVVMEYVEGSPLHEYCQQKDLDVRGRLRLFQKVCSAVSYAHRKLVVHRDLKPPNILVSEDGDPKIVDFGIGKLLDPVGEQYEAEAAVPNFRVLTPEYASPEQLNGEAATTSTDIYSLGVVLHELLTGARPHRSVSTDRGHPSSEKVSRDPQRPSFVASRPERSTSDDGVPYGPTASPEELTGDLDNIILKALSYEPERRYQSVSDLSEDIERYLSGLPVNATPDSKSYRFAKFYQRHKAGVLGAGVASALLVGTTVFATWQYFVAQGEREVAERRFEDLRGLARTLIFDHYERIKNLPGATEAREKLISDALTYLDRLAEESAGDKELQRELVAGYARLAEIQYGTAEAGNLGMQKEAKENFMKALAIQESLAASPDSDLQDLRGLANMYLDTIDVLVSAKETARRGELISRGYEIFVRLRDQNPDRKQARVDVARALWYRATDVRSAGDNNASIRLFNEAIEMYEQLEREFPEDIRIKRALALSLKNVGGVYTLEHNNEEALRSFRRALAIDEESARHAPNDVLAQMDLSFTHASLGSALRNLNDREGAISAYSKALAIQEGLYSQDPKNHFVKMSVFRTGAMLAENLSGNKRFPEALTLYKRIFSLVASTDPMSFNPLDRGQIAAARLRFGLFFEGRAGTLASNNRLADLVRARSELESSTAQFAQLEKEKVLDPSFVPVRKEAAESLARVRLTLEKLASR